MNQNSGDSSLVTFYHDIEQDIDSEADPDTCREIVRAFLDIEKRYGTSATYNVVGKLFDQQPDLIDWIYQAGHEVAFHSYNHFPSWQPEHYTDEVRLCAMASPTPKGYRSPRSQWNHDTVQSIWQNGFLWNAESDASPSPYFIYRDLVRLPIAGDDWPLNTGDMDTRQWTDFFVRNLHTKRYFGFGCHDTVVSFDPEERLRAWENLLSVTRDFEVKCVTFSQASDLFRSNRI
ncbi:polysaccharide deacetylase family protein [Gammaproteobacteria bacterium]|nr:polysaccharide deacetylase family protein [Gammaproteobacteria bacterium]